MTRLLWLGAALVFLGSTAAGFALRQELRLRLRLLTAVIDSLNLLRSDIVGRLAGAPEPLSTQYAALADGITDGGRPFSESWAAAFQALDMLTPDVRAALLTLGEQLGKYDAQIQRRALDTCIETLQAAAAQMQADTTQRGKLFCGLGATLGLLAAVALF